MQYKYIAAYKIRGLIHDPNKGDVEIYTAPNDLSFKAILTGNVDNYCYELDRARALGYQMLRGFAGKLKSKDQKSEIEKKIDEIRKRRQKKLIVQKYWSSLLRVRQSLILAAQIEKQRILFLGLMLFKKRKSMISMANKLIQPWLLFVSQQDKDLYKLNVYAMTST